MDFENFYIFEEEIIPSLKRAGQIHRSSQREGYLTEQCKMSGGTVNLGTKLKNLTFKLN